MEIHANYHHLVIVQFFYEGNKICVVACELFTAPYHTAVFINRIFLLTALWATTRYSKKQTQKHKQFKHPVGRLPHLLYKHDE